MFLFYLSINFDNTYTWIDKFKYNVEGQHNIRQRSLP